MSLALFSEDDLNLRRRTKGEGKGRFLTVKVAKRVVVTIFVLYFGIVGTSEFLGIRANNSYLAAQARDYADDYASEVSARMFYHFEELAFLGGNLTQSEISAGKLKNSSIYSSVLTLLRENPGLAAINVLDSSGKKIIWSTAKHPSSLHPTPNSEHIFWSSNDRMLVGPPVYSKRFHHFLVSTRYASEVGGKTAFYVGSPYYLSGLLSTKLRSSPYQVYVGFAKSEASVFQVFSAKKVQNIPQLKLQRFLGIPLSQSVMIPSAPWKVIISWNSSELLALWMRRSIGTWLLDALGLLILTIISTGLMRRAERNRRFLDFEMAKSKIDTVGMSFEGALDEVAMRMIDAIGDIDVVDYAMIATLDVNNSWQEVASYGAGAFKRYLEVFELASSASSGVDQGDDPLSTAHPLSSSFSVYFGSDGRSRTKRKNKIVLRRLKLGPADDSRPYFLCIVMRQEKYLWSSFDKEMIELSMSLEQNLRLLQSNGRNRYLETMYKALSSVGEVVLGAKTASDVLCGSCSALVQYPFFVGVGVVSFDRRGAAELKAIDGSGDKEAISIVREDPRILESSFLRLIWDNGEPLADDHLRHRSKDPLWQLCERYGWHSCLGLPLEVSGTRRGVVFIVASEAAVFHGEMLDLCRRLTQLIGRGIAEIELKNRLDHALERESRLARVDPLTGLPNRLVLDQTLDDFFRRSEKYSTRFVVGVIDLDNFKPINDTFGHLCGDEVLREFSRRLKGALRPSDFVARLGGDEFVVVLEIENPSESLEDLLGRLEVTYARAFKIGEDKNYTYLQISLGVAIYPEDGTDPDVLLRRADAALYQSKANKIRRKSWWERWRAEEVSALEDDDTSNSVGLGPLRRTSLYSNSTVVLPILERRAIGLMAALGRSLRTGDRIGHFSEFGFRSLTDLILSYLGIVVSGVDPGSERERLERDLGNIFAYMGISFSEVVSLMDRYEKSVSSSLKSVELEVGSQRDVLEFLDLIVRQGLRAQFKTTRSTIATCRQVTNDASVLERWDWQRSLSGIFQKILLIPGMNFLCTLSMDAEGELTLDESSDSGTTNYENLLKLFEHSSYDAERNSFFSDGWRNLTIVTTNFEIGYLTDGNADESRVRSVAAVPLYDSAMKPVSLLILAGRYLDMFDAPLGRQLLLAIQSRLSTLYQTLGDINGDTDPTKEMRRWRNAMYADGLEMYFQPIVDLKTGELKEVEGLARLILPDGSIVGPNMFIPIFNSRELEYLLKKGAEKAISDVEELSAVVGDVSLSINIHPKSLTQSGLADWLKDLIQNSSIGSSRLKLELLESDELLNSPRIEETLAEIRELGVTLAMDDFGSGHSNIARLREIEFNGVKIDQLVLRGVYKDPLRVLDLLGMAITLGRDLGLEVTVEGIEDLGSLEMAAHLGAHRGQGYVIARPMPKSAFTAWYHGFVPMRRTRSIRYSLGALASHWRFMHTNVNLVTEENLCPLQLFIENRGLTNLPLSEFHRAFHAAVEEQDRFATSSFSKSIMNELALLCVAEANTDANKDAWHAGVEVG